MPQNKPDQRPAHSGDQRIHRCVLCGAEMLNKHCKLRCMACGFVRDCSDP